MFSWLRHHKSSAAVFVALLGWSLLVFQAGLFHSRIEPLTSENVLFASAGDAFQQVSYRPEIEGFFIHPGENEPTRVQFELGDDAQSVNFKAFILGPLPEGCATDPSAGIIDVVVSKNGQRVGAFHVDRAHSRSTKIPVDWSDNLQVSVDKAGASTCDWGGVSMHVTRNSFAATTRYVLLAAAIAGALLLAWSAWRWLALYAAGASVLLLSKQLYDHVATQETVWPTLISTALTMTFYACVARWRFARRVLAPVVAIIFLLPPCIELAYRRASRAEIGPDEVRALMQTNFSEAMEYLSNHAGFLPVVAFVVALIIASIALALAARPAAWTPAPVKLGLVCLIVAGLTIQPENPMPASGFVRHALSFAREIAQWRKLRAARRTEPPQASYRGAADELHVLIIGESLNRRQMSLYGYPRATTPMLDARRDLFVFDDAVASHTHTAASLSYALTAADTRASMGYLDAPTLTEIARAAGLKTSWWSNQNAFGIWDNAVSIIAEDTDERHFIDSHVGTDLRRSHYDEDLLSEVTAALQQPRTSGELLVIHLMGNHADYCERFPPEWARFTGEGGVGIWGAALEQGPMLNCYDDAVRYNDKIVTGILSTIEATNAPATVVYFSDHGEDVVRGFGHDGSRATPEMVEIPVLVWLSPAYRQRYPNKGENLERAKSLSFNNSDIFHLELDLAGIDSNQFDATHSPANAAYKAAEKQIVARGALLYSQSPPAITRRNVLELRSRGETGRLLVHRANSVMKAGVALASGLGFEVDVMYDESSHQFVVGHDHDHLAGIALEAFLTQLGSRFEPQTRIWLDTKNLNPSNMAVALAALERLDERFGIKQRAIVESDTTSPAFASLSAAGFKSSYYLPTGRILEIMRAGRADQVALASAIATQLRAQRITAVSFDQRLWPFVTEVLEPRLDPSVEYHLWDLTLSIDSADFSSELEQRPYEASARLKTILVKQPTPFDF